MAGGIDLDSIPFSATQCYDLHTGAFNAPNADLGPLPEPWWGMADGWKMHKGRYQIWLANGVRSDGALIGKSVGESVEVVTPSGQKDYEIVKVRFK